MYLLLEGAHLVGLWALVLSLACVKTVAVKWPGFVNMTYYN